MEKYPADAVSMIKACYADMPARVDAIRQRLDRPMTLAEKILFSHWDGGDELPVRGETTTLLHPDRVAMQDATAQMAILQFMTAGQDQVQVPSTIHCDHLVRAKVGAIKDLEVAEHSNHEVYEFLASAAARYGLGFWEPGSGIIHQVVLENYAYPGGMMIGTDSHTPNAGGLGMIAIGVGGADAVDVMVGLPWELKWPKLIGVHLTGEMSGWTSGKDLIMRLAGLLTTSGGTGKIVEYFGPGTASLSCTAKATVTNMGAEIGATTSVFPFDERMSDYLRATDRTEIADAAEAIADYLVADVEVLSDPAGYYDEIIEINLSELEPYIVGPHSPDIARPVSGMAQEVADEGYPDKLTASLIGSCTNSSYEDIGRAAAIARQASKHGLKASMPFMVTPGSEQVHQTIERDGLLADLEAIGGTVLANACGPCIGQWERTDPVKDEPNSILTSYNRNFRGRNDGSPTTNSFIASPEVVTAYALAGSLSADPLNKGLVADNGDRFILDPPQAPELPADGFGESGQGYRAPPDDRASVDVSVDITSERLALLDPFEPVDKVAAYRELPVLLKANGKCTTDHISPAGPWLRYRGHLDHISDNMFSGADNVFADASGAGCNFFTGSCGDKLSDIARDYKDRGQGWVAVGDTNYGEGSSREHAAMSPRYLGCRVVLVRSFARIHETNLKKQGVLPLTFADPDDYNLIMMDDRLTFLGLDDIAPGKPVQVRVLHADGTEDEIIAQHSMNVEQIGWYMAGSALNLIRSKNASNP